MRQRLHKFGFGLLLGVMLSYAFFSDSDWTGWMPNGRVLAQIKENIVSYNDNILCQLDCYGLTVGDVNLILEDGDVDFGDSKTHQDPMIYQIYLVKENGESIRGTYNKSMVASELTDIRVMGSLKSCDCK